jgi:uncharacterized protein (TIGR00730 family)
MEPVRMKTPAFSLCVYCGSKPGTHPEYAAMAEQVGIWIASHGGQLVYGGGRGGLMGIVADAALRAGGSVIGIIPKALVEREWAHRGCTELHIVETMHERKHMMAQRSDAFLAMPGGIGTLEELFEVWTWRQLGYHDKPIGLLNAAGYYQGLMHFLDHAVAQEFLAQTQRDLVIAEADPLRLLPALVQAAGLSSDTTLALI